MECDVLVIGAGMAGLMCALELPSDLRVVLLSKNPMPTGSTFLAQGGLAAATSPDDSVEMHLADTKKAGGDLVDEPVALRIISMGATLVDRLRSLGVSLEGAGSGIAGIEGGHSRRRILHQDDRTGKVISEVLSLACRARSNIEIVENAFAVNLITEFRSKCLGSYVLLDGEVRTCLAGQTVLATGGAGKVYRYTSNQDSATGDGIAMAYRAGLPVRNMEFFQFHPTCLFHPEKRNFLVTEALRGEGARLLNLSGKRFMSDYDPERMELAPRDVVARAMDSEMKRLGHDHVLLDATHLGRQFLEEHFPEVTQGVTSVGIIPWESPIPVVPAAHYCVGGVVASPSGETEMPGLRVIGEAASTGFHGANRLASNSLLEAGVMGILAARSIPDSFSTPLAKQVMDWSYGRAKPISENVLVDHAWASLRSVMWDYVGIVRTDKRLKRSLRFIEVISEEVEEDYWMLLPCVELLELRNICTIGKSIVRSALKRRESRGLHFNLDCPEESPQALNTLIRQYAPA